MDLGSAGEPSLVRVIGLGGGDGPRGGRGRGGEEPSGGRGAGKCEGVPEDSLGKEVLGATGESRAEGEPQGSASGSWGGRV